MDAFDPDNAAAALAQALRPLGTAARAEQEKRYLKSDLEFLGVGGAGPAPRGQGGGQGPPGGRRPARHQARPGNSGGWALALWREPVHERRAAAIEILSLAGPALTAADLAVVEQLIRESRTWAYVDTLAGNIAGAVALRDASSWARIDSWAADEDFWVRRSALLALLPGIRSGQPDLARFTRYAEPMLGEKEFFIRKAIGWVLREASRRDPQWVAAWTDARLAQMSGVTFREAVRRLPAADKARLELSAPALDSPPRRRY